MRILVTGVCGFVGSSLAMAWLERDAGHTILGVDNLSRPGSEANRLRLKRLGVQVVHGDVRAASDVEALPEADALVDAAANPSVVAGLDGPSASRQLVEHNLAGTVNMLEYCRRHRAAFVLLSTSRVYSIAPLAALSLRVVQDHFEPVTEGRWPGGLSSEGVGEMFSTAPPASLYGTTKLASEHLALEYGETFGFPVWVNRCGVLAGAGQFGRADQGIYSFWINCWLREAPLAYIGFGGQGHQVRDCLHPADLVSLLDQQLADAGADKPRIVNVGGGRGSALSLRELSMWCRERMGERPVAADSRPRPFDVPWLVLDTKLVRDVWGWQPTRGTGEILEDILEHARRHPEWLDVSAI